MKITIASQDGIDAFEPEPLRTFLREILDQEDALVTDESSLLDFVWGEGEEFKSEMEAVYEAIEDTYRIDIRPLTNILAILRKIEAEKGGNA